MTSEELMREYEELRALMDLLELGQTEAIESVIPDEVRQEVKAIQSEFEPKFEEALIRLGEIVEKLKVSVVSEKQTCKGERFVAVFNACRS